jgi:cytochrome c-type biogenesis protein CcmH/NrfG
MTRGETSRAISELEKLHHKSSFWRFYLARAYELDGNLQQAVHYYQEVMKQWDPCAKGFFYREAERKIKELQL